MVNFLQFKTKLFDYVCFSVHQAYAVFPEMDKNNLTRWTQRNYLVQLRNEWYTFPEYTKKKDYAWYIANKIYHPSYISLHSALAFYGMIPEEVVHITSVSSRKTMNFENDFGLFVYKQLKPELFFGYELKPATDKISVRFASPEKAILDVLYLNPYYKTPDDMENLRLDPGFMLEDFDKAMFENYLTIFDSKTLEKRAQMLLDVYDL
ncbi:MAG: type IV toxin-antitoxin system AbiEi family antitoxin domain-containing protein [Bacteroidota bacterium]